MRGYEPKFKSKLKKIKKEKLEFETAEERAHFEKSVARFRADRAKDPARKKWLAVVTNRNPNIKLPKTPAMYAVRQTGTSEKLRQGGRFIPMSIEWNSKEKYVTLHCFGPGVEPITKALRHYINMYNSQTGNDKLHLTTHLINPKENEFGLVLLANSSPKPPVKGSTLDKQAVILFLQFLLALPPAKYKLVPRSALEKVIQKAGGPVSAHTSSASASSDSESKRDLPPPLEIDSQARMVAEAFAALSPSGVFSPQTHHQLPLSLSLGSQVEASSAMNTEDKDGFEYKGNPSSSSSSMSMSLEEDKEDSPHSLSWVDPELQALQAQLIKNEPRGKKRKPREFDPLDMLLDDSPKRVKVEEDGFKGPGTDELAQHLSFPQSPAQTLPPVNLLNGLGFHFPLSPVHEVPESSSTDKVLADTDFFNYSQEKLVF